MRQSCDIQKIIQETKNIHRIQRKRRLLFKNLCNSDRVFKGKLMALIIAFNRGKRMKTKLRMQPKQPKE